MHDGARRSRRRCAAGRLFGYMTSRAQDPRRLTLSRWRMAAACSVQHRRPWAGQGGALVCPEGRQGAAVSVLDLHLDISHCFLGSYGVLSYNKAPIVSERSVLVSAVALQLMQTCDRSDTALSYAACMHDPYIAAVAFPGSMVCCLGSLRNRTLTVLLWSAPCRPRQEP